VISVVFINIVLGGTDFFILIGTADTVGSVLKNLRVPVLSNFALLYRTLFHYLIFHRHSFAFFFLTVSCSLFISVAQFSPLKNRSCITLSGATSKQAYFRQRDL
jgi:hypothetical protein